MNSWQHLVLVHYSKDPLYQKNLFWQPQDDPYNFKPRGLWVSVEDNSLSWKQWCEDSEFNLDRFVFQQRIILKDLSKILYLSCSLEVMEFDKKYKIKEIGNYRINWNQVASEYQGIIIAPYCWSLRLNTDFIWYYSWDCSSGCIWDTECIESITHYNV